MTFGEVVKENRERLGMTRYALTAAAGITSPSAIRRIEEDGRDSPFSVAVRICRALGISLDAVAELVDPPHSPTTTVGK